MTASISGQGLDSAVFRYLYDNDYQLTQAGYPSAAPYNGQVHAWTYDGIGNRTSSSVNGTPTTYAYYKNGTNPLNGQYLESDGVNAYTFDANGNTATRNGTPGNFTFGWDTQDRMTSISGSAAATYRYDYQGRRVSKTVGGATTTYLYDGLNLLRTTGASQADYLFGPGIDEPLAMVRNGTVSYFDVDGIGSVALLTNPGGTVQKGYLYDAWGTVLGGTGTLANDFGYTAREPGEASLMYYRARYYQPGIGRFVSEDPIGFGGGMSLYGYVSGNPLGARDPSGMQEIDECNYGPWVCSQAGKRLLGARNIWDLVFSYEVFPRNTCKCVWRRVGRINLYQEILKCWREVTCCPGYRWLEWREREGATWTEGERGNPKMYSWPADPYQVETPGFGSTGKCRCKEPDADTTGMPFLGPA
jgi:RHS repeat-associated protein